MATEDQKDARDRFYRDCAEWACAFVGIDDLLFETDPYSVFAEMDAASDAGTSVEAFMEEAFAEDLANGTLADDQAQQAFEEGLAEADEEPP